MIKALTQARAAMAAVKNRQISLRDLRKFITVDKEGRLLLPAEITQYLGLKPGQELFCEVGRDTFRLHRPVTQLARIYIEPTTRCNMNCSMCQRHFWSDAPADMKPEVFQKIMQGIDEGDTKPTIVFGGFGEPLVYPEIMNFIRECKYRDLPVEMITNGLLLNPERIKQLVDLQLDRIWLSLDNVNEVGDGHARPKGVFNKMIDNLKNLPAVRYLANETRPYLGVVFVAMKNNVKEFPQVFELSRRLNVDQLLISNLLPYAEGEKKQILYPRSTLKVNDHLFHVTLPRFDMESEALNVILKTLREYDIMDLMNREYPEPYDTCPFIKKGSVSIGWDGRVSPCPPLLHTHNCHFQEIKRQNRECIFGSLATGSLQEIWHDAQYKAFRKRVMEFDFPPCVSCANCELAENNETDCYGTVFPACGGCLWAQGLIQCP